MSPAQSGARGPGQITIVGAGIAGLSAAIECASEGASVRLLEAHATVGGRARSTDGSFKANLGPHAAYDGPFWRWLKEHEALPAHVGPKLTASRIRWRGELRRTPPLGALPSVMRLRGRQAPVAEDFRSWAASHTDETVAEMLSASAGVYTFYHDPGSLSAAFVWPRSVRLLLSVPSVVRYPVSGWSTLVSCLERRARALGVRIETGHPVDSLPEPPVIVATELADARRLLGEPELDWLSGRTLCMDLGLRREKSDPGLVLDMDEAGWVGRYSTTNPSVAPEGEELVQAQMPIRPEESVDQTSHRLERLLDTSLADWRERVTWRRRQVMDGRSGALDLPGSTWSERPAVDRGDGVYLAGDMVAAPGLLAEVSWASAIEASHLAIEALATHRATLRAA